MIKHFKLFGYDFTFVFRHRFEKKNDESSLDSRILWKEWNLGVFFKKYKVVGKKDFNKPKEWGKNLVNEYMFGINLLWFKTWFTVGKNAMSFEI